MKTLNEQINEVLTSKKSKSAKRADLIKLGLCNLDVAVLFKLNKELVDANTPAARVREVRNTLAQIIKKYTFGVEIECFNAPCSTLIDAARDNGLLIQSESYNHRDNRRYYKLVPDASIRGEYPIECVSPILKGNSRGFNSLKSCCTALNQIGAMVNKSTGLHVHIGGGITESQYVNTFVNYFYLESVIDTFMAASRRDAYYASALAHTNQRRNVDVSELLHACTFADVFNAMHGDRYYKINCCSWQRHGTIEFRQHSGTTNYEKIQMWATFCLKLVAWSAENRLTNFVSSIDDIPFLTAAEKRYFKQRATALAGADE